LLKSKLGETIDALLATAGEGIVFT
jgi:hypothetical protein